MGENFKNLLTLEAERALFDGQVQSLVVTCYQNERPPGGLSGTLDWHFQGSISKLIKAGVITGKLGECVYLPFTRHSTTFHLILIGAGDSTGSGQRSYLPTEILQNLQKNLISLRLSKIGISRSDFGGVTPEYFVKYFKGVSLWIAP